MDDLTELGGDSIYDAIHSVVRLWWAWLLWGHLLSCKPIKLAGWILVGLSFALLWVNRHLFVSRQEKFLQWSSEWVLWQQLDPPLCERLCDGILKAS